MTVGPPAASGALPAGTAAADDRPGAARRGTGLGYQPALDGLRGLALLAIIVYHADTGRAPGAFLSVSTFFTLSGFLITTLLLAEHRRSGRISLAGFWDRRFRRLLPASLVAIGAIVVAATWLADASQLARLRGDALSALLYVANWRFILAGDSYGASFDSPSPFTHFWTLAIEEQLYLVLPLVVLGLLAVGRGSRRWLAVGLVGLTLASTAWSTVLVRSGASLDRVYFGTDTRLAELTIGGVLALWWARRSGPLTGRPAAVARVGGPLALAAMVTLWLTADLRSPGFYQGGLLAYSLLTCIAIVGAVQPDGLVRRALALRPLVWAGLVSYGAYLAHYPILLWLGSPGGLGPWARLAVALPLTFAVAAASARWLERPVRAGRWPRGRRRSWVAVPAGMTVCAVLVVGLTAGRSDDDASIDFARAVDDFEQIGGPTDPEDVNWEGLERMAIVASSRAPRVATFGDSSALMTGIGLDEFGVRDPEVVIASPGFAQLGCGVLSDVLRRADDRLLTVEGDCTDYLARWEERSAATPADVAVVQLGPWDVLDTRLDGEGPFLAVGEDPSLDRAVRDRLATGVDVLARHHGMVVLVLPPDIEAGRVDGRSPDDPRPESDPARMERFRQLLADIAAERDRVETVDLAGWLEGQDDDRLRPDGIHFTRASATEVAAWLGPELARLHEERTGQTTTLLDLPPP